MEDPLKEVLKWAGIICVTSYWIFAIYRMLQLKKFKESIPTMPDDALIRHFKGKSIVLTAGVLSELKNRNRSLDFALPKLIDASTHRNAAVRILGWSSIEKHIPEIAESLNYNSMKPSKKDKETLRALKSALATSDAAHPTS